MENYNEYVGKPFRVNGRGPDDYDCYGLVKELCQKDGYELPELDTPESVVMRKEIFQKLKGKWLEPVERAEPKVLVVLDFRDGGIHIGYMVTHSTFIHTSATMGTVKIHHLSDDYYSRFVYGFYTPTHKIQRTAKTARV